MGKEKPRYGRDKDGTIRVGGKFVPRIVCDLESADMATPTPGPWSAALIDEAMKDPMVWRAYLHLCNTFAERHAVEWCEAMIDDGCRCPDEPSAECREALKLLDEVKFETVAGIADFMNLIAARARD